MPLNYEERRLSVQGCAACGSGLRENRRDASGQTNRVLCLNVVSESYYPGGESIHTQFYNMDGVGPSSTSTSGDTESEGQEPQEVFGVNTSRWNRRNVEGRGPMTRSLSPTPRVFESMSSSESPERATSEPPLREDDRGSELWEECTIESLREVVCGRRGFSALGESRPASCTNPRVGVKRPGSSYQGKAKARVTNQSPRLSTIFGVYFQNKREGRPKAMGDERKLSVPTLVMPPRGRGVKPQRPTWHDLSEVEFPSLPKGKGQGVVLAPSGVTQGKPLTSRGRVESESQDKGPGNEGSGERVKTPLPDSPKNSKKGPSQDKSGRVRP